jgi:hypothetical protein
MLRQCIAAGHYLPSARRHGGSVAATAPALSRASLDWRGSLHQRPHMYHSRFLGYACPKLKSLQKHVPLE